MIKQIKDNEIEISVDVKDSTEPTQRDWSNGFFSNRSVLNFIKSIYKNGAIIDIGSGIGNNTLFFSGVLGAFTHTIEPDEIKVLRLKRNIMLNEMRTNVLNYAVSDYAGLARMERNNGLIYIKDRKDLASVRVTTVDSVIFDVISLMYIDVNGQDEKILSGSKRTIRTDKPHLFIRTENAEKLVTFLSEKIKVEYRVKYAFNNNTIYYLEPFI